MIHPIDPGWLRTGDALHKRERRQGRRRQGRKDEQVKKDDEPQPQESPDPEASEGTFDLVA